MAADLGSRNILFSEEKGFCFDNCKRNAMLGGKGQAMPTARKTGTTICGVVYKRGIVLGADTRATEGDIVADKNCQKIHYIADNIYCCGAGTAADTDKVTRMISARINLHKMEVGRMPRVVTDCKYLSHYLYGYQGHIGAALVLGGVDSTGPNLYIISPNGYCSSLPFTTMGSGSLAAMANFEAGWHRDMEREEAMQLVRNAIAGGVFNDLGSGSNIDLCVLEGVSSGEGPITKVKVDFIRPYEIANKKGERLGEYKFASGTTPLLRQTIRPIEYEVISSSEQPVHMES